MHAIGHPCCAGICHSALTIFAAYPVLVFFLQVGGMAWVAGIECDVSSPASVQRLMSAAASQMGSVDVWINNAGNSGTFQVPNSLTWYSPKRGPIVPEAQTSSESFGRT